MVAHSCNLNTQEAKAGGYHGSGHYGPYSRILSFKKVCYANFLLALKAKTNQTLRCMGFPICLLWKLDCTWCLARIYVKYVWGMQCYLPLLHLHILVRREKTGFIEPLHRREYYLVIPCQASLFTAFLKKIVNSKFSLSVSEASNLSDTENVLFTTYMSIKNHPLKSLKCDIMHSLCSSYW